MSGEPLESLEQTWAQTISYWMLHCQKDLLSDHIFKDIKLAELIIHLTVELIVIEPFSNHSY